MTRFLVVDDEEHIRRFMARSLQSSGYEVDSAATGSEALQLAASTAYALVTLDLMLPDIDGYQLLERLLDRDPTQRVVVVSAVSGVESKVRCLRIGAVDYICKPFAVAELLERAKRRVEEHASRSPAHHLEVAGVRLDLQRRMLIVDERPVALSTREFVLLEHLMRRPNEVCTREELLDEVWGFSFDPGSNVVDACVKRLRSKLGGNVIETIRNVGYSFGAT